MVKEHGIESGDTGRADSAWRLDGQVAVVTGGGTGIGQAIGEAMGRAGATVVLIGRREGPLREAARRIGEGAHYFVHDVTDADVTDELFDRINTLVGTPSILINNAGVHLKQAAVDTSETDFSTVLRTHVNGAFAMSTSAARLMMHQHLPGGSVVFIASMASLFGIPQVAAYSAAKTAQVGLVRSLATEWSPHGIRVNAIAPGWIDTDMSRSAFAQDPSRRERVIRRTPIGRLGTCEEVAHAVVYLCTPAASFITGAVIPVDGGASIGF